MALNGSGTAAVVLDIAETLVQTRGFNGFSYADISGEVGISKASLHYHFPTKAALGKRLVDRHTEGFLAELREIDRRHALAADKLKAYVDIYARVLKADRMCLCGMLAADYETLPKEVRAGLNRFFHDNEEWLALMLARGRERSEVAFAGKPAEAAHLIVSALEGALLVARARGDSALGKARRFRALADGLVRSFAPQKPGVAAARPLDA